VTGPRSSEPPAAPICPPHYSVRPYARGHRRRVATRRRGYSSRSSALLTWGATTSAAWSVSIASPSWPNGDGEFRLAQHLSVVGPVADRAPPSSRAKDAFCVASSWLGSPFHQPPINRDRAVDVEHEVVEAVRGPSWHFDLEHAMSPRPISGNRFAEGAPAAVSGSLDEIARFVACPRCDASPAPPNRLTMIKPVVQ
jgi:hypothetical protein